MGVITITRFQTQPGQSAKHMELHLEACGLLRGMGMQAVAMQPLAGGDIGSLLMSVNYASNAAYATAMQQAASDEAWGTFYAGAMASGAAVQVESSIFSDVDPAFQPDPDRPLGVVLATQWSARPGRLMDFVGNVMESMPMVERMGGRPRALQSVIGAHPMTTLIPIGFDDLDAYGAYADTIATDAEWQAFWAGAMADPTADLVRSGVYLNISEG